MNLGFWQNLPRPFFVLAPMEDVTDVAFRQMFATRGRYQDQDGNLRGPDALFTEFTSADGLVKGGFERLKHQLFFEENERPIVVQLFSADPKAMLEACELCAELGFDGIDINMGCPSKTVCDNGAGCGLIKTPELAQKIVAAAHAGSGTLPVSVKTRLGFSENEIEEWVPTLLETQPAVLTMHGRTRDEMSKVPTDWQAIARTREIRDELDVDTLVVGNGDVETLSEAKKRAKTAGVDGVMVGRGAFGNPWFFNPEINREELPLTERLTVMVEHAKAFDKLLPKQHFAIMRKHFKAYTKGLPAANNLRNQLMQTKDSEEVAAVITDYRQQFADESSV